MRVGIAEPREKEFLTTYQLRLLALSRVLNTGLYKHRAFNT